MCQFLSGINVWPNKPTRSHVPVRPEKAANMQAMLADVSAWNYGHFFTKTVCHHISWSGRSHWYSEIIKKNLDQQRRWISILLFSQVCIVCMYVLNFLKKSIYVGFLKICLWTIYKKLQVCLSGRICLSVMSGIMFMSGIIY